MTSFLHQAVYVPGTTSYKFLQDQSANLPITKAPADANLQRWSMLQDGETYRLYCFKGSTKDKLYQFGWNGREYEYGYQSEPELTITGIPEDADTGSFSMVYGENNYHLYFHQLGNPTQLYQFLWDNNTANYVPGPTLQVLGFPNDTDWSRWSMLNDGGTYRIYAFKLGSNREFHQGAWNGSAYEYGYGGSHKVLTLEDVPPDSNFANMELLHDGTDYRLYLKALYPPNPSNF